MRRNAMILTLIAAMCSPTAGLSSEDESWERYEQQEILSAEIERARALGGFNGPLTAIRNLSDGTATERDVVPGYSDFHELPGRLDVPPLPARPQN